MTAGPMVEALAEFYLAQTADLPLQQRLHADDGSGRCKSCRSGGDSSGKVRFPCTMAVALSLAMTGPRKR